ncbi:hypothetical protein E7T06_05365 [Deinococcus sp. Arct2-2]|uniref:hypothetical protein n=1 Tax=Deinococcus sp. Arct2-2 TaxID=2568653 RepID=UPI0010A45633|nr:hypothetical protein [Deinococcus sp. Arct2-2]THF70984.1 hypothetical protein E7T06_05365 [Deinococcus sp. Arct2-2]
MTYRSMAGYYEWNTALIEHVTHGAPVGSTVYLEVSDETLNRVGIQRWGSPPDNRTWREDFLATVQDNCTSGERVATDWLLSSTPQAPPLGVAFLGAMVLAASNMATDAQGQLHERNYFRRLSDVLGVPLGSQGRPPGLPTGAEEPLWRDWLVYLRSRGLDSTAKGGEGPRRFIAYPISQTLIPEGERRRLRRLISERGYPAGWDGETLASRLRADGLPSTKLRELLSRTGAAAEDVQMSLLDVLQGVHAAGEEQEEGHRLTLGARQLVAGLYREEHWRTGEAEYRLFPRQPRGIRLAEMAVHFSWGPEALKLERPGFYQPLGEVTPAELKAGMRYEVTGSPFIDALVLPARDYWVLRQDPEAQGLYASLGTPGVGEHLLLLLRDNLLADLQRFQEAELVYWPGRPEPLGDGWLEIRELMVIGNHWDEVPAGAARALHEALRPPGGVSVHLEGGVRAERGGAYLAGAAPAVRVMSFALDAHLRICRGDQEIFAASVPPGDVVRVPFDEPGTYDLVAESRGVQALRTVRVVGWEELRAASIELNGAGGTEVNGRRIWGAHVWEQ